MTWLCFKITRKPFHSFITGAFSCWYARGTRYAGLLVRTLLLNHSKTIECFNLFKFLYWATRMLLRAKRATADLCIIKSTKNNQSIKPVNPVNNSRTRSVQRCCLMTIVKNFESVSLELTHINDYTVFLENRQQSYQAYTFCSIVLHLWRISSWFIYSIASISWKLQTK